MTCPRCHTELEFPSSQCPDCGLSLMRSVSGMMKTSAVMIAAGREQGFYRSVQDVPEPLRTQLIATTSSSNSGTILIADRAGKEQLTEVIARRAAARGETASRGLLADERIAKEEIPRFAWLAWTGFFFALALILILSAAFALR